MKIKQIAIGLGWTLTVILYCFVSVNLISLIILGKLMLGSYLMFALTCFMASHSVFLVRAMN